MRRPQTIFYRVWRGPSSPKQSGEAENLPLRFTLENYYNLVYFRGEIKAIVIEYDSNHSYSASFIEMDSFYSEIESWFQKELLTAPPGMKGGWFVSELGFYDLQLTLSSGTILSIGVSMTVALAVVFLVSLNVFISFYAVLAITCTIFVTVSRLLSSFFYH